MATIHQHLTTNYLDSYFKGIFGEYLKVDDYCPNGIQVDNPNVVSGILFAVTLTEQVVDKAIQIGANVIVVHHGIIWKNAEVYVGKKSDIMRKLYANGITLFAYHLPLDQHREIGNNVMLMQHFIDELNITGVDTKFEVHSTTYAGNSRDKSVALTYMPYSTFIVTRTVLNKNSEMAKISALEEFMGALEWNGLGVPCGTHAVYNVDHSNKAVTEDFIVAICTGGGHTLIGPAIEKHNCHLYITGETSLITYGIARDNNVCFAALGHHATERYGIMAMKEYVQKFVGKSIPCEFYDTMDPA